MNKEAMHNWMIDELQGSFEKVAKETQEAAEYVSKSDNADQKCGNCTYFNGGSCSKVEGPISSSGVCKYWESKEPEEKDEAEGEDNE